MEYVFPKEDMDAVLTTLKFNFKRLGGDSTDFYSLGKFKLGVIRKAVKAEKIPEFKEDRKYQQ